MLAGMVLLSSLGGIGPGETERVGVGDRVGVCVSFTVGTAVGVGVGVGFPNCVEPPEPSEDVCVGRSVVGEGERDGEGVKVGRGCERLGIMGVG